MDFRFTEEQLMIQDVARRIAQEKIAPSAEHHDQTGEFPLANIRTLGENGLMGIEVPTEYGGAGMDPISYVLAMIEIAHVTTSSTMRSADASLVALIAAAAGARTNAAPSSSARPGCNRIGAMRGRTSSSTAVAACATASATRA